MPALWSLQRTQPSPKARKYWALRAPATLFDMRQGPGGEAPGGRKPAVKPSAALRTHLPRKLRERTRRVTRSTPEMKRSTSEP
eukprot:4518506-Pyramimonas_sp.AAC.1